MLGPETASPRLRPVRGARALEAGIAAVLLLLLLLALPRGAVAQEAGAGADSLRADSAAVRSDTARLVGQVVSALTGEPIGGAAVSLRGTGRGAVSDSTGRFAIPPTRAGIDTLDVRYIGYESGHVQLDLAPGRTTRVTLLLSPTTVRLAELEVEVRRDPSRGMLEGFERRKARGMGTFFDLEDIESRNPRNTSDLLRGVPGLRVGPHRMGGRTSVTIGRTGGCAPEIFVDGLHLAGASVDDVIVPDLGGVEVYPGPSLVPTRFAMMAPTRCGAIIIWTRRGGPSEGG